MQAGFSITQINFSIGDSFVRKCENRIFFHEYTDMEIVQGECSHSFPAHIHEVSCAGLITSGRAEFSMNGSKEVLSTGDYYVIPPYTLHTLSAVRTEMFQYCVICIKNSADLKKFDSIVSCAKTYIEKVTSDFNVDELSNAVHISKYHLDRIFKQQVGITPYQFYINNRVKKIRQGLQARLSLSDMVFDLNFSDQSHLCNTFKKYVGISPTQYVRSYQYNYNSAGANFARIYKPFSPAFTL